MYKGHKKIKKVNRNCHRLEETKETEHRNAMWDTGLDPGPGKGHGGEPQSLKINCINCLFR